MRRVDLSLIGQGQYFCLQRVVEHRGHLGRGKPFGPDQVRAADIADKERVPGKQLGWCRWLRRVGGKDGDPLRRMARRFIKG